MAIRKATNLKTLALAGCALSVIATAAPAVAQSSETYEFDIDRQDLGEALTEFGIATGNQVLFNDADVRGKTANDLEGVYTSSEAVELLLRDTGVEYRVDGNGTLLVGTEYVRTAYLGEETSPEPFRVAQLDQEANVREVDLEDGEGVDSEKREDVIVVTGTNIRGVYPGSAPLDIYTADEIEMSGATTLDRFLETLPQNVNSLAPIAQALGPGQGSITAGGGIDLRGLGVGTTLVLLNGRRLTAPGGQSPDTSLIPFGAIERVEVLSDGASAVYGSDAIGGVVNLILRDDFEGVDINTSYSGATRGGHDRFQSDLAAGTSWGSGSGFVSYSYATQSELRASERDFSSAAPSPQTLVPDEKKHSVFGAIDQNLTDRLSVFGNVLYSTRDSELNSTQRSNAVNRDVEQDQIFVSTGLEYQLNEDLFFNFDATYLEYEESFRTDTENVNEVLNVAEGSSLDLLAKIDGDLIELPAGAAKFSLGGGFSEQEFKSDGIPLPGELDFNFFDRNSYFLFAETFVPIVSADQDVPGINRLELSAAVRYTDYSDFGGASTPRFGVLWSPVEGLNLRGTYSRGFRAPELRQLNPASQSAVVVRPSDFGFPDTFSSDGSSVVLLAGGPAIGELDAEFSDTFTVGFDIEPQAIDGLRISGTYYNIDYTDRLGVPLSSGTLALLDQEQFGFLFDPNPASEDIVSLVDGILVSGFISDFTGDLPIPPTSQDVANFVTVFYDGRTTNLASSKSEGIDLAIDYGRNVGLGDISLGARFTHTITANQRVADGFPETSNLDTVGNAISLKGRAYTGFRRGGFSGQMNVNYVDGYENTFVAPEQAVDDWITVDLNLRYGFENNDNPLLDDLILSLTVNNLFDTDPPFVEVANLTNSGGLNVPAGYDPVNANPLGRFVTIGLAKRF